uniref:ShKT domain-containing protein n=1 Tax=Meloidogyne hapla TaxID=6305 RepID=A0A1I8AZD7_MELHA
MGSIGGFPVSGGSMGGIDPGLIQQACAAGEQQYCSTQVQQSPTSCNTDTTFKYTCPRICGLCNG